MLPSGIEISDTTCKSFPSHVDFKVSLKHAKVIFITLDRFLFKEEKQRAYSSVKFG